MNNRLFDISFKSTTILVVLIFILLFLSLAYQLKDSVAVRAINRSEIFFAVKLSLLTATITAVIALVIGIPVAYLLAKRHFKGKVFVDTLFDLTIVLSPIAIGAMILVFFNTAIGKFIENNIVRFVFDVKGIILAQFFIVIGYSIRFLKSSFETVDQDYEDIARTLGASSFKVFTRITLPLASKGIIGTFFLIWARAMGEFGATMTVAGATTMKTETLPVAIFLSFESTDVYGAIIFIIILVSISLAILILIKKILHLGRLI